MVEPSEFAAACGRCVRLLESWEARPERVDSTPTSHQVTDQVSMAADVNRVHAAQLREALGPNVIGAFQREIERPELTNHEG